MTDRRQVTEAVLGAVVCTLHGNADRAVSLELPTAIEGLADAMSCLMALACEGESDEFVLDRWGEISEKIFARTLHHSGNPDFLKALDCFGIVRAPPN